MTTTDNELNALVAERLMGWKRVGADDYTSPYHALLFDDWENKGPHKRPISPLGDVFYLCGCNGAKGIDSLPDYANDIAAAWQVALKVASLHGYSVTIHVGDEVWIEKAIETDSGNSHLITWQDVARVGTAQGDARSICLAALDAMGVTVEVRAGVGMTWDISAKDHDELRGMFGVEAEVN